MFSDSGADVSEPTPAAGNSPTHDDGYGSTSGSMAPGSTSLLGHEQEDQCPVRRGRDVGHLPLTSVEDKNEDYSNS